MGRTTMDEIEKTRSSLDEDEEEESKSETPNQCVHISKLQRCAAWSQADESNYHICSFDDEHDDESKVNMVHWDEIVHGSIECDNDPIFRQPTLDVAGPHFSFGSGKLDRCAAWSVDDSSNTSSNSMASSRGSVQLGPIQEETTKIHWDEIVKDSIYA